MEEVLPNPLRVDSLIELIRALLDGLIYLGTIALLIALVWVGAQFAFAQGAEEKLKDARRSLMWTVIGGAILLGAEGISYIIEATAFNIW